MYKDQNTENQKYLKDQIITYLGNKRVLLEFIHKGIDFIKKDIRRDKISFCDMFSGSGIVSRYMKQHSNFIIANDLELYSKIINECYLSNKSDEILEQISILMPKIADISTIKKGFIRELYAPQNEDKITQKDRVFYTKQNAGIIDTIRQNINLHSPDELKPFFIAPLLHEASVHANTSGVFKGFYKNKKGVGEYGGEAKNALSRIKNQISLKLPIFSNFTTDFQVLQEDANSIASVVDTDICYLDPPYNQHPYGSNYFMLNLIAKYQKPSQISKISGIEQDWNRSIFNKKKEAKNALLDIVRKLKSKYILISYNCEGFVKKDDFLIDLNKIGKTEIFEQKYNAFRASRNLNSRTLHVNEQLYLIKKY